MIPSALLLLLLLGPASADLEIRWRDAPGCITAEPLPSRVATLTNRRAMPPATVELAATEDEQGWQISLAVRSATRSFDRTLHGRDCTTLTEAVALIVAVQLDPVAVADSVWAEGSVTPPSAEVPVVQAEAVLVPASAGDPASSPARAGPSEDEASSPLTTVDRPRRSDRHPRALLGADVAAELGVLPRGAATLALTTGVAWPRGRVELRGLASLGPDGIAAEQPSVGGRFRLFGGSLRGCGLAARGRFELPICGGMELGDLRAKGTGLREPATVDALWVAVVGGTRLQWVPRPRLAVGALLELMAPLRRHRFVSAEAGLVHEVDPIAARFGLHLELRLP